MVTIIIVFLIVPILTEEERRVVCQGPNRNYITFTINQSIIIRENFVLYIRKFKI